MTQNNETNREERALDALIVAAFVDSSDTDEGQLNKQKLEGYLTEEDKRALDALGSELVRRITSGEWEGRQQPEDERHSSPQEAEEDLLVAMNRGDGELSPEAREEIEKNIEESEREEDEEEEGS